MSYRRGSYRWVASLLDSLPLVQRTHEEVCASTSDEDKATEFIELVDGFERQPDKFLDETENQFCTFFLYWWSERFHLGPRWCGQIFYCSPNKHIQRIQERGHKVVVLRGPYSDEKTTVKSILQSRY